MTVVPPPLSTRSATTKQAFDRVLKDVVGIPDDDLLFKVLDGNGISSIPDLLTLSEVDISTLSWDDGNNKLTLNLQRTNQIKILQAWNVHLQTEQGMRRVDWLDNLSVNEDEWDEFRVSDYNPPGMPTSPSSRLPSTSNSSNTGTTQPGRTPPSAASEFRRGIKRNKSDYNTLKDEKQWDDWKRATVSTVYAHGCENILSASYIPGTPDEIILFSEQNKFMYDVYVSTLQTPMGKHFVRQYEGNRDAQAVWRDYLNYMRSSTRADIEIEDLMTALTSTRIDPQRGMAQQFILGWLDKIRMYEDLTPISAHFPDNMKKAMLQNAISPLQIFKDVKVSEQMEIAKGKGAIAYRDYVSLVQQVAAGYDKTKAPSNRRSNPPQQANEINNR
jgi:hypothetical protein